MSETKKQGINLGPVSFASLFKDIRLAAYSQIKEDLTLEKLELINGKQRNIT